MADNVSALARVLPPGEPLHAAALLGDTGALVPMWNAKRHLAGPNLPRDLQKAPPRNAWIAVTDRAVRLFAADKGGTPIVEVASFDRRACSLSIREVSPNYNVTLTVAGGPVYLFTIWKRSAGALPQLAACFGIAWR